MQDRLPDTGSQVLDVTHTHARCTRMPCKAVKAAWLAEGQWWCGDCETLLPVDHFYIRRSGRMSGRPLTRCRDCMRGDAEARTAWQYRVDYAAMLAAQGGRCALCGTSEPRGKGKFLVDHDHRCCPGKSSCGECVRALLCVRCNSGLGHLNDDPELLRKAGDYVETHSSKRVH